MNYKLRFWDGLFRELINIHMVNGNSFDWRVIGSRGSEVIVERLDYNRTNKTDFLRYIFKIAHDREVVYAVDNSPTGDVIRLVRVSIHDEALLLDGSNPLAEDVMREGYLTGVESISSFWYC